MAFFGVGIGLGVAGFDPAGALVLIALLAMGASRRTVAVLCLVTVCCTTLMGTVLARVIGVHLAETDFRHFRPPEPVIVALDIVIGLALIAFGVWRMRRQPAPPKPPRTHGVGVTSGIVGGLLVGFGSILDPAFIANVALASRTGSFGMTVGLSVLWAVLSHSALIILTVCVMFDAHAKPVAAFDAWWLRARPTIGLVVNWLLVALGGCFLLEDAVYWTTGSFVLQ